jgi:two-component system CheB/CheR fusion protein
VFEQLGAKIIPDMVASQPADMPLRIWIAGCSTGEEAYSLAMLFREAIVTARSNIKLQMFASDVDADAVAQARDGLYPHTIKADVSPERLARFFMREDHGFRVSPELRTAVVFTVQDVLADPPFSRLDLVSCRNLLIYLGPEAQAKVIALFHFALRELGILLLGNAETIGSMEGRFEVVSKAERLYRHTGRARSGEIGFSMGAADLSHQQAPIAKVSALARQTDLAELCRLLVMESYAPASVLINRKHECLYSLGPTEHYLRIAPGHPSHDLLDMAAPALRTRLRAAISQITTDTPMLIVPGGKTGARAFNIHIRSVHYEGEELLLICFIDAPTPTAKRVTVISTLPDSAHIADLEQELEATRSDLQGAILSLEKSGEDQRAINEEAMSVNEEFQSTNEELLTSKEELQSLNEELTALNSQLQETLERQRTTSNDLQNVLYSTDVATLFLDEKLNIRFFTPATKALFNVIPGDIGRPLADLHSLASDSALLADASTVVENLSPIDAEIETNGGVWFTRRIMPYLADNDAVEGVVITFTDITERKRAAKLIDDAKKEAELATVAKSRFLAVASHDLRQPLQTLALLQGLLSKKVQGEKAQQLVARLDETLSAMTGMLNTLLDINQIESGVVKPEMSRFALDGLLDQLRDEFSYLAQAKKLDLRVVGCGLVIESDRRLLEQLLRNLISNALKYTKRGKILFGCRRRGGTVSIQVLDTGIGIADVELKAIFDEYHQVDNAARERSRGLGLGLSIVQRLSVLLDHQIEVHSVFGRGSSFAVEIKLPTSTIPTPAHRHVSPQVPAVHRNGKILIVEDDPEVRVLLGLLLDEDGQHTHSAEDGPAALKLIKSGAFKPDLVLTDYNLPHEMDGLLLAGKLRKMLGTALPVIILTGDISTETLRDVAGHGCVQFNKPVKVHELLAAIQRSLAGRDDEGTDAPQRLTT